MGTQPPKYIANFDSASAMLRATAYYLHGRDFPALGLNRWLTLPASAANLLPPKLRRALFLLSGRNEALPPRKIDDVDAEELSRWVTSEYPKQNYPAVAIGSSNGAAVHLHCALGIPWLPQTFLLPIRQSVDPDEPDQAMRLGLEPGRRMLERNPDLQLHHMHDANQDRVMVRTMTYFRVKRRRLGEAYRRFLIEHLPPGGTIIVNECERTWPVTRISDRHVFQHGAVGGATEEEFLHGSERVSEYLAQHGSKYRRWPSPEPDERAPEAEWGFEPALLDDIREIAEERDYRILRLRYPEPQALSPLVADLYRGWYQARGISANRLLLESFIVLEPWWTLRTGAVPFWMEFNMEPSLNAVHKYLDSTDPFDEIRLMLFNHGVEAVGLPTVEEWESLLRRARRAGSWVGAEPPEFPLDYAQFARYHTALQQIPARHPMPEPLALQQFEEFVHRNQDRYHVRLDEDRAVPAG